MTYFLGASGICIIKRNENNIYVNILISNGTIGENHIHVIMSNIKIKESFFRYYIISGFIGFDHARPD